MMEELLLKVKELETRLSILENKNGPTSNYYDYEQCSYDISMDIISKSKNELYVHIVNNILSQKDKCLQIMDDKRCPLLLFHKEKFIKGNETNLKNYFEFIETLWIKEYKTYLSQHPHINDKEYEHYNIIIYGLNIQKDFRKIRELLYDKLDIIL